MEFVARSIGIDNGWKRGEAMSPASSLQLCLAPDDGYAGGPTRLHSPADLVRHRGQQLQRADPGPPAEPL